jgi:hypothetical protein
VDSTDGVGNGFGCLQMPASPHTLAAERHPAGVRSVSGGSGRRGVEARGGERGLACASRLLVASSLHARELERRRTDVVSGAWSCPGRRGRRLLGVEWWRWCTSGLGSLPGDSARSKGAATHAGLVGGTEGRGGLRGARPGSLSSARSTMEARVYPYGWQVGQGSPLGECTRLASGGVRWEREGTILQDLGMHKGSGSLSLSQIRNLARLASLCSPRVVLTSVSKTRGLRS